jgi:hypothetical protein
VTKYCSQATTRPRKFNLSRKIQMLLIKRFFTKLYSSSHIDTARGVSVNSHSANQEIPHLVWHPKFFIVFTRARHLSNPAADKSGQYIHVLARTCRSHTYKFVFLRSCFLATRRLVTAFIKPRT